MIVVMQCAARKREDAGYWKDGDGRAIQFVARPDLAPEASNLIYARPDELCHTSRSWRDELFEYNATRRRNPMGLLPAWQLYENPAYGMLADRFGPESFYVLSAGWGLIRSDFLTPVYDITFSASADPYKRRRPRDRYADLRMLPESTLEPVVFFVGKDYVELAVELSSGIKGPRHLFYNSQVEPSAPGFHLVRYVTRTRTNWHYECARAFISGGIELPRGGVGGVNRFTPVKPSEEDTAARMIAPDVPKVRETYRTSTQSTHPVSGKGGAAMPSKYDRLRVHLESLPRATREVTLTFAELERILGATLPRSAVDHRPWWANQADSSGRPQAAAWMNAGFQVDGVHAKQPGGWVRFRRR